MAHEFDPPPSRAALEGLVHRLPGALGSPRARAVWALWAVGAIVACGAGWWLLGPSDPPAESVIPLASSVGTGTGGTTGSGASPQAGVGGGATASSTTTAPPLVVVQAAGAVARPGVYRMSADARVDDLVRKAGGFTDAADQQRVNLASPVADGERIWIPAVGEGDPPVVVAGGGGGGTGASAGGTPASGSGAGSPSGPAATEPVDLNTATAEQLDTLPGVGPATAAAIMEYREQSGGFRSVDDLLEVSGIGDAKLERLRPLVRV